MTLLGRVEAAQDAHRVRVSVMRDEVPALLEVLGAACTLELSKLARAEPSLAEWSHGAVAVISQLIPVKSVVLVIDLPGAPPVAAGYGVLADAGAQVLQASRRGERVFDAEVLVPLPVSGLVVGSLALGGIASIVRESGLIDRLVAKITGDLVDVSRREQAARAEAPGRVRSAVVALGALDDERRFEDLAAVMAQLPDVVGVTMCVRAPWLMDALTIHRGWTSGTGRFVHDVHAGDAEVAMVVDGSFAVPGSITAVVINETVEALREALESASTGWTERLAAVRDPITGLVERASFLSIVSAAILRAEGRGDDVGVVALAVEGSDGMRSCGGAPVVDTLLGRAAAALLERWGPTAVARVDRDHLAIVASGVDRLELEDVSAVVREMCTNAIRPRGIAPRAYRCVVGAALATDTGSSADQLIDKAVDGAPTDGVAPTGPA